MSDLVKRGSIYHIFWWEGGKKHSRTTGTADYNLAKNVIQREHDENLLAKRTGSSAYSTSLDSFITDYLSYKKTNNKHRTWIRDSVTLRTFRGVFPTLRTLQGITIQLLEDYKSRRLKDGVIPATVNREMGTIRKMLSRAEEMGILKTNPGPKAKYLKETKSAPRFLDQEEINTFLASRSQDLWWNAAYIALYTGQRPEEILFLTWKDIEFERARIVVTPKEGWTPKDHEQRWIPMERHLAAFLARLKAQSKSKWVISFEDGARPPYQSYCAMSGRIFKDLAIPDATLYTMRHTFASYLSMAGVPLNAIMRLLGHAKIETTMIYAHLSPEFIDQHTVSKLTFEK